MLGGVALFYGFVGFHFAVQGVYHQHAAGFQARFFHNVLIGNIQNAHFRGKNQPVVVCYVIARGAQAVAVKGGAHHFAIGEQKRRRAIPGLHHGCVVVEHVAAFGRNVGVFAPRFGHQHHYRFGQFNAAKHQKFQRVVKHGAIGAFACNNGHHAFHVVFEKRRAHGFFTRIHAVKIAADGINFTVVQQHAVGVRALPTGVGVGGKTGMNQRNGAFAALVLQVKVELAQLLHQKHAFIHHSAAAKRCHVAFFGAG